MNIVNGSKSFYRFMKRDGVVLAYFYVDDFWNHSTTEKLKNVFAENNNNRKCHEHLITFAGEVDGDSIHPSFSPTPSFICTPCRRTT